MDNDLLNWIINEMDETQLQDICKKTNLKIPGFRSIPKYPRLFIISSLLKNKNKLFIDLKKLADDSEEKEEFNGKDIIEIEQLIDIRNKNKTIEQITFLMTQDKLEYTNLAYEIIDRIKKKDNILDETIIDEDESHIRYEEKSDNYNADMMKYKDEIICKIGEKECDKISKNVILHFQNMTDCLMSGDDSYLKNTWDEICFQVQQEESFCWKLYLQEIESRVNYEVKKLDIAIKEAIWLQTKEGIEWEEDDEEKDCKQLPICNEDIIRYIVTNFVLLSASKYDYSKEEIEIYKRIEK